MNVRSIVIGVAFLSIHCFSSDAGEFVEVAGLPRDVPYLGARHTSWVSEGSLFVVVEQVAGIRIAEIECRIRGEDLHLEPVRISSGGSGTTTFQIALPTSRSPEYWAKHMFWVTRRTYTPVWLGRPKQPSERVAVSPAVHPYKTNPGERITSSCR